jgi:DNA-directed RNA polymerase specialized sigma24 family protein
LSPEDFETLLKWLGPDRELAGQKYEEIRLRLIKIFVRRGCLVAEELADETIDRVCYKIQKIINTYTGDPALYFYGVAQKVYLEYIKKKPYIPPMPPVDSIEKREARIACLELCLERLDKPSREFILLYFQHEKQSKIDHHKQMAEQLGVTITALRMRACRIKAILQKCMGNCLRQSGAM